METNQLSTYIKDAPLAVALLDENLCFFGYSKLWCLEHQVAGMKLEGKSLFDLVPGTPKELKKVFKKFKAGKLTVSLVSQSVQTGGGIRWLNWKISRLTDTRGTISGLMVVTEDITKSKREEQLLQKAVKVAKIGGWEVDLITNKIIWSRVTKKIHQVPKNYEPSLESGIDFYKAGEHREKITELLSAAISDGTPWDSEMQIITAKGNERWVHTKGHAEKIKGKTVRLYGTFQDITQKKKAELKFRKASERLSIATAGSRVGIWEFNISENTLIWDNNMYRLYGIQEKDFNGVFEAWKSAVHPDDKDRANLEIQSAIEGKQEFDTEFRVIWPNGEIRHIRAIATVQSTSDGNAVNMIGTNWDITDLKSAQMRLSEITSRHAIATQAAKIGIWEYDFETREVYWDDITRTLYGLEQQAKVDLTTYWKSRVHPDDLRMIEAHIAKAIKDQEEIHYELRLIEPDGNIRFLKVAGQIVRNTTGRATNIIGTNWDITTLKTTQLELVRSEASFSETFENSAIGMALVDKDGVYLRVNQSLSILLGYTSEELLKLSIPLITPPEDLKNDLLLKQELMEGSRQSYQKEKRYVHKKGHLVFVNVTVTAVYNFAGEFVHFISQVLDITPRIEAEKRLTTLMDVTKDQNDNLMNFAHIVSHNLRSHATNMSMLTNFLSKEEDVDERNNILTMLINASESLNETVQHLNEVVQVKTNVLGELKNTNLLHSVRAVEKNLAALIKEHKVLCKIKIPKKQMVKVVPAYLDSILLNIFTNAIKYRSPDRKPLLEITSVNLNGNVLLSFRDNGQGIDLDRHRDKMFGMYKTFHKHKDAKGIGLFITKNQIESMNGKIDVQSEVGVGTTFTLQFLRGVTIH